MQEVEKKTLWKILETEDQIKRRVTEDYVNDCMRLFEDRLKKDQLSHLSIDQVKIDTVFHELRSKIGCLETQLTDIHKQNRKSIKNIEDQL